MLQRTNLWFTKSRRAQNVDDYETWITGGVVPTLNAFDNGDVRTTVLIMRMREGKPGGGQRTTHQREQESDVGNS